ncbi:S8 family serine peptidase [Myceligenerans pegani]|uniref:S8 family serine peptidase n=1 Tax=Myceligenerans pegani TaxID=2776917 RepID=A0ABR9N1U2_9MICO|nr:S8 family serine peptidase [Myceligenerans sp. TRM 65318]MBE1877622.1 S8 family serine peptidase [Myceligenerans sp. TRM 65318]MBE3019893.1 S8 family serine peptidase [Myceligenerans sp. TRM 65318]
MTLLTGDVVTVRTATDGSVTATVRPGPGREHMAFFQQREGDHLYVIPRDVAPLVPGRLDRALFDVTGLVEAGYDDASRDSLPVIVQTAAAAAATAEGTAAVAGADTAGSPDDSARVAAPAKHDWASSGITPDMELESVGAVADVLPKGRATKLLDALAPAGEPAGTDVSTKRAAPDGVGYVWLDQPVRASDADSTPQIGAPEAWEAGFTGEGVTVAVLDSGIDATHPDLDDVVAGERDFTGKGDVTDGHGHGTHVASILTGSGEASDGANRGVAPDADLLVGKVLDDDGYGETSDVIDGMEWAAAEGADVVNLSLGSLFFDVPSPDAVAVDELTEQYGTLFVVAAGNFGELGQGSVGSPGIAASALTVGAVDDADTVTPYSSRGGADAGLLKPDVVAPGDGIVAARAEGTTMGVIVDDLHVAESGTSMAAPHVAGAAAVLKQARPDLDATALKSALMGSAEPTGADVWSEGAGRITVPGAIAQQVAATPSVSFGTFTWPHDGESASGTVTYTNAGADDVALTLATDVRDAAGASVDDAVTLSADSVVVPAGGTVSVDVTVADGPGAIGAIGGTLVATGADGETVRTPVGWAKEREYVDLTVRAVDRNGRSVPADTWGAAIKLDPEHGGVFGTGLTFEDGVATARVIPGVYSPMVYLETFGEDGEVTDALFLGSGEVDATSDVEVLLDGTTAEEITTLTHRPAEPATLGIDVDVEDSAEAASAGVNVTYGPGTDVALTPVPAASHGDYDALVQATLLAPTTGDEAAAYRYDLAHHSEGVEVPALRGDDRTTVAVETTYGASVGDTHLAQRLYWHPGSIVVAAAADPVPVGTRRTEYVTAGPGEWLLRSEIQEDGVGVVLAESTRRSWDTPGRDRQGLAAGVLAPGNSPITPVMQWGSDLWLTPSGRVDDNGGVLWGSDIVERLRVWQDGELIEDVPEPYAFPTVPEGGADYRMLLESTPDDPAYRLATSVTGEWTFRARSDVADDARPPLLDTTWDVRGLDLSGSAPGTTWVRVRADHQDGAYDTSEVKGARLWWSADDGDTWHRTKALRIGDGTYAAPVRAPAGTEHVSLRVEAWDAAGATVTKTVVRAYAVD